MEPINYMLDVKNPIEEAMRGYALGRGDIEQRQVMQEREQMMGLRGAAEARAAQEFEMRRAEAERLRADAEAKQARFVEMRDKLASGEMTTSDFSQWKVENAQTVEEMTNAVSAIEKPKLEAMARSGLAMSTALLKGNIDAAFPLIDEYITAAENTGTPEAMQEAKALEAIRRSAEIDPESAGLGLMLDLYARGLIDDKVLDATLKAAGQGGDNKEVFDREKQIRKEYTDLTKEVRLVQQAYDRVVASQDTGPGDVSLIFGYMKMLDPMTGIKEGEVALASQTSGIPDTVVNLYNSAVTGERLTQDQRASFKSQAADLLAAAQLTESRARASLMPVIKQYGLDANQIFGAPGETKEEAPAGGTTPAPAGDDAKAAFMANPKVAALAPEVREMAWKIYQKQTGQ